MTYKQTLDWMYARLPMYQHKGPKAYNGKLDNILALSSHLGNPHKKFKSIHVAGTNGKGSSSHMLASVLQEAAYKVGLYTSPHLKDFRERIRVNGQMAGKSYVIGFVERNFDFLKANRLSFFEMTVGMAFEYFAKKEVDIAIIEVGLGGRLDSTNIITPEVSLITNIGLDHVNLLGDNLVSIAKEKAGIIKPGVPVVISETQEGLVPIFQEIAAKNDSPILFADQMATKDYKTDLLGNYQPNNTKGVQAVLKCLKDFEIDEKSIIKGLSKVVENTGILGRYQILRNKPKVVCDIGHNKEGIQAVMDQLTKEQYEQLHIVIGFVKDKDLSTILPLLPKNAHYYFAKPEIPRALSETELKASAKNHHLVGEKFPSVPEAYKAALYAATDKDLVFVGGSTFTVAEVL